MDDRMKTLESIRTEEQKKEYEDLLNRNLIELEWFESNEDPLNSIIKKIENPDISQEARESLMRRRRLIETGEYRTSLERNITSIILALKEFGAKEKGKSLSGWDFVKGVIARDPEIIKLINDGLMKSRAEKSGLIMASPVNMELQSKEDVLKEVFELYDFINIPRPEIQEKALVPVDSKENEIYGKVREMLDECLKDNGIGVHNVEAKPINDSFSEHQVGNIQVNKKHGLSHDNNKTSEERDEI